MLIADYVEYEIELVLNLLQIALRSNEDWEIDTLIRASRGRLETAKQNFKKQAERKG